MTEFESKCDMVEYIFVYKNLYWRVVSALDDYKIPFCYDIVSPDTQFWIWGIKFSSQSILEGNKKIQISVFNIL